jgi:hypothetical protein
MTQKAVDGCRDSGLHTTVIVVEKQDVIYSDCLTLRQPEPFNYNRCLNFGAKALNTDYVAFLNNDIEPYPMWGRNLIDEMEKAGYDSGSPKCSYRHKRLDGVRYGYQIGWDFCGWAFVLSKNALTKIGKFDETFTYWCSDNIVAHQLETSDLKHLITSASVVNHIGNKTGETLDINTLCDYTWGEAKRFKEITGKDIFPPNVIRHNIEIFKQTK